MAKTHLFIAAAASAGLAILLGSTAPAAAESCTPVRDCSYTGDCVKVPFVGWVLPDLFELTTSEEKQLIEDFGIYTWGFASEPGGMDLAELNGSYRRLINALLLLGEIDFGSQPAPYWQERAASAISQIVPSTECGIVASCYYNGFSCAQVKMTRLALRDHSVLKRASTVMHEAKHGLGAAHVGDEDDPRCQGGGSCDFSWGSEGSQREQIDFIIHASERRDLFSDFVLEEARESANEKLNNRFESHPLFNLSDKDGGYFQKVYFDHKNYSSMEAAFFPDPDEDRHYAIVGLGAHLLNDNIVALRVYRRELLPDGTLGRIEEENRGRLAHLDPELELVFGDPSDPNPSPAGYVVTGFKIQADKGKIESLGLYKRGFYNGYLYPETFEWAEGGDDDQEAHVHLPQGEVLTAIGLRSIDENIFSRAYSSMTLPYYSEYAGGTGGDEHVIACPTGQVAVGTVQNVNRDGWVVGQFGLICTDRGQVWGGQPIDDDSHVVRGSYYDTLTGQSYPATTGRFSNYLASAPHDIVWETCDPGYRLNGVEAQTGALVDRINRLQCRKINDAAFGPNVDYIDVYVGGSGGSSQLVSCPSGMEPEGLKIHSGWYTDGFALHCREL